MFWSMLWFFQVCIYKENCLSLVYEIYILYFWIGFSRNNPIKNRDLSQFKVYSVVCANSNIPADTRRHFNVYMTSPTSYRRLVDAETTSCVNWDLTWKNSTICVKQEFNTFLNYYIRSLKGRFLPEILWFLV